LEAFTQGSYSIHIQILKKMAQEKKCKQQINCTAEVSWNTISKGLAKTSEQQSLQNLDL